MGLTKANAVGTPGTKNPVADYDATKSNESEALQATDFLDPSHGDYLEQPLGDQKVLDSLTAISHNICRKMECSTHVDTCCIPSGFAYSCIYGMHPKLDA